MSLISRLRPRFFKFRYRLAAATAIFVGVVVVMLWLAGRQSETRYLTAPVTRGTIQNLVTATGILQPRDYVDVGAQVSGQLHVLHVGVGSEVAGGDLLAEIDATVYSARVDATRAQLRFQRAQLQDREAQLKLAEIHHRRQLNLQREDATTIEEVEGAEAGLQSARAQIDSLLAQIDQIESTLRAEEANLEFARIHAPMNGTVVSITSRQGQTLNANQTAPTLLRIADLSIMTVQAQVSEADVGRLRPDMPVYFTTLGSQGRRWHSRLNRIEPTPEILNNVVLYNALFEVPNDDRQLMTQMTAEIFFVTAEARDVLLIPMAAVESLDAGPGKPPTRADTDATRYRVQVLGATGRPEERIITAGVSNRVRVEVLSGLREGDVVITGIAGDTAAQAARPQDGRRFGRGMRL